MASSDSELALCGWLDAEGVLRFLRELDRCFLIEAERTTAALNSASGSIGVKEGRG